MQLCFDRIRCFTICKTQTMCDAKNMRIDRNGRLAKRFVHHHICRLAPDTRQCHKCGMIIRHFAVKFIDQFL